MPTESPCMNATGRPAAQEPCRCGCADCAKRCCRLECLVQPRFYCGQLLTDTDLNTLLQWTQQKLRLGRYHYGWGVVHGLHVRLDPKDPLGIVVAPGYAVDCCGDDVVVCEDYPFSLQALCADEVCFDPRQPRPKPAAGKSDAAPAPDSAAVLAGALAGTAAFDIFIRYDEQPAEPQSALGYNACGQSAECAFSRTREAFKLEWRAVDEAAAPGAGNPAGSGDLAEVRRLLSWIQAQQKAGGDKYDRAGSIQRRLRDWINAHPLREFSFVDEWLAGATQEDLLSEAVLARALFWLAQDYRNAGAASACDTCDAEQGVPLARVWLRNTPVRGAQRCRILALSGQVPYRRPITPFACRPVDPGCVRLDELIWHTPGEVEDRLAAAGVKGISDPAPVQLDGITSLDALQGLLACDLTVACGDAVEVRVVNTGQPWGERVVGFCKPDPAKDEPAKDVPPKDAHAPEASPPAPAK